MLDLAILRVCLKSLAVLITHLPTRIPSTAALARRVRPLLVVAINRVFLDPMPILTGLIEGAVILLCHHFHNIKDI